ncbi:type II toxin-antitoxin system YafO family toxin [Salmonella enterica]|nr:type II toxin-antitoxin system YafO family toxin [Salmonella enterica]EJA5821407.1 type II toxin-antitoxin system YafO family toxin [Salmonella enterica]EJA5857985.1 type II toxin-antitoxin system YafO family toxin [Salmonella enterica]EJF5732157.1 type II toxin-antitoxin system YafO family toxin [Salmonella enterica]EJX4305150.1 type II toxin-antitoxin system YafO family toxin [Salmonella enterica]
MVDVSIHKSLSDNPTVQGYARELSDFLNGRSLSGRIGRYGGFERNNEATKSSIMKVHIKMTGEGFWSSDIRQINRTSNSYLVYAMHWNFSDKVQIIAIVSPDAHERIDRLLPDIIRITESDFHSLSESELNQLELY